MQSESATPRLLSALDRFRQERLPRMAREEAYSGWIAHFLMLEFGVRRVIVESHHDGRALSSALRQHLRPGCESWLPEAEGRGGAMNYDIVVARHDDVDARTFQTRFRGHATATIEERRREAARHLLQFALLLEVKLVDSAADLVITDMMVRDLIKLAATSIAIDEFCDGAPTPETAFVVVVRGACDDVRGGAAFLRRLSERAASALEGLDGVPLPRVVLVSRDSDPLQSRQIAVSPISIRPFGHRLNAVEMVLSGSPSIPCRAAGRSAAKWWAPPAREHRPGGACIGVKVVKVASLHGNRGGLLVGRPTTPAQRSGQPAVPKPGCAP